MGWSKFCEGAFACVGHSPCPCKPYGRTYLLGAVTPRRYDSRFKIQEQSISHAKSHILNTKYQILNTTYPSLALLVSGGHTEIVLIRNGFQYEIIGQTLD